MRVVGGCLFPRPYECGLVGGDFSSVAAVRLQWVGIESAAMACPGLRQFQVTFEMQEPKDCCIGHSCVSRG